MKKKARKLPLKTIVSILYYNLGSGHFFWKKSRGPKKAGKRADVNSNGYRIISYKGKNYSAHRIAIFLMTKKWPAYVDHINGNPSDNRACNLRVCNQMQNLGNSKRPKHNKSGVKGVFWNKEKKKWDAQIQMENRRSTYLGRFEKIEDAAACYAAAARKKFGEFARLE